MAATDCDFYSEPTWVVAALLRHLLMCGAIQDPCCGNATVVDAASDEGLQGTGADIVDRANGRSLVRDFLAEETRYRKLVFNPPYRLTSKFVNHALVRV